MKEIEVKTAGLGQILTFDPGIHCCGGEQDCVAFEIDNEGTWVIPYRELWRLVSLAREARKKGEP